MKVYLDLETIPDQTPNAVQLIADELTVKAPDLTKPKLIDALDLDPAQGKFKTVPELKEMWLEKFGESAKMDQAEEKWLKTSFDGGRGEICCIGVSISGKTQILVDEEKPMLIQLNNLILGNCDYARVKPDVEFVAHNAKFDLPFLHKRFVINKVKPQFKTNWHGRHGQHHFCTMEEWAGFGGRISQDNLCEILGLPTKPGMTGADVWPEYQKGNIEKIAEYCKYDVETVIELHKRLTFGE
jgi:3'-5' exonuclease